MFWDVALPVFAALIGATLTIVGIILATKNQLVIGAVTIVAAVGVFVIGAIEYRKMLDTVEVKKMLSTTTAMLSTAATSQAESTARIQSDLQAIIQRQEAQTAREGLSDLKRRTVTLTLEMSKFLIQRNGGQPPFPDTSSSQFRKEAMAHLTFRHETSTLFFERFWSRVKALKAELDRAGVTTPIIAVFVPVLDQQLNEINRRAVWPELAGTSWFLEHVVTGFAELSEKIS